MKVIVVVVAYLRKFNIRLASYLDDWLTLNKILQNILLDRMTVLRLLYNLGFMVNKAKSQLTLVQLLTYLGSLFDFKRGIVSPTVER